MYVCLSYFILYFIPFYVFISFLEECSNCRWWIRRKIITTWGTSVWSLRLISWVEGNCSYYIGLEFERDHDMAIFSPQLQAWEQSSCLWPFWTLDFPFWYWSHLENACLLSEEIMRIDPVRSRGWSSLTAEPLCPQQGWGSSLQHIRVRVLFTSLGDKAYFIKHFLFMHRWKLKIR